MVMSALSLPRQTAIAPQSSPLERSATARAYDSTQLAASSAPASATVTFSAKAQELLKAREVSESQQETFRQILQKAEVANAQADPKAFLHSLSGAEMDALREVHSLAQPIDLAAVNDEGAANLLIQPGSARDLDNNGLTTVGASHLIAFPPNNAPESFKAAWASVTAGRSFGDIPSQMILAIGVGNIHVDPTTGQAVTVSPDDPQWRNPYAEPNFDYAAAVQRTMDGLRDDRLHNRMSEAQFQHDMDFYERLSRAMG